MKRTSVWNFEAPVAFPNSYIRSRLHTGIPFHEQEIFGIDQLANANVLPIASGKRRIGRPGLGGVVQ